jgi:hypothetical protein
MNILITGACAFVENRQPRRRSRRANRVGRAALAAALWLLLPLGVAALVAYLALNRSTRRLQRS